VRLLAADARGLALDERFALVLAPFNTLMHLERIEEQDAALAAAREHLAPGGAFACDVFVPRFAPGGPVRAEAVRTESGAPADLLVWQRHDPVRQLIVSESRLDVADADGRLRRSSATLRQRYFGRFELERALRSAGFADVRCYGDFDRGPVREASSVWAFVARGSS
jgi:SAM-dependent methyltransferase